MSNRPEHDRPPVFVAHDEAADLLLVAPARRGPQTATVAGLRRLVEEMDARRIQLTHPEDC